MKEEKREQEELSTIYNFLLTSGKPEIFIILFLKHFQKICSS